MENNFKIEIPVITDNTLKLFVNNEFVGEVNTEQVNVIRLNAYKYIYETGDTSVLDTFYFIGHEDSNYAMGKEIKITMVEDGNFSDLPWELAHVRRCLMTLMEMDRKKIHKNYE
jgi:hypothetical protein